MITPIEAFVWSLDDDADRFWRSRNTVGKIICLPLWPACLIISLFVGANEIPDWIVEVTSK